MKTIILRIWIFLLATTVLLPGISLAEWVFRSSNTEGEGDGLKFIDATKKTLSSGSEIIKLGDFECKISPVGYLPREDGGQPIEWRKITCDLGNNTKVSFVQNCETRGDPSNRTRSVAISKSGRNYTPSLSCP